MEIVMYKRLIHLSLCLGDDDLLLNDDADVRPLVERKYFLRDIPLFPLNPKF